MGSGSYQRGVDGAVKIILAMAGAAMSLAMAACGLPPSGAAVTITAASSRPGILVPDCEDFPAASAAEIPCVYVDDGRALVVWDMDAWSKGGGGYTPLPWCDREPAPCVRVHGEGFELAPDGRGVDIDLGA